MKPRVLAAALGKELQAFRAARVLRQDDVARSARRVGLPWTRMVVRALEAGRRELSIDEFALLPLVLERLGAGETTVWLESGPDVVRLRVPHLLERDYLHDRGPETPNPFTELVVRSRRVWPEVRLLDVEAAYAAAGGDLEQKVGRRLRLDPTFVALAARRAWGRSLTEERDARVATQAPAETAPRALQGIRGHVTRALLTELEPRLIEARKRQPRKRGRR